MNQVNNEWQQDNRREKDSTIEQVGSRTRNDNQFYTIPERAPKDQLSELQTDTQNIRVEDRQLKEALFGVKPLEMTLN